MVKEKFDIIIIGAGAAGIMAAKILSDANKKVCLLEARERIGGRVNTITKAGFSKTIETGAEFIHGNLPLTISLLKDAGIKFYETEGELWQLEDNRLIKREDFMEHADELQKKLQHLDEEITVADFLKKYFSDEKYTEMKRSLRQYMEGYDAADINFASALSLKEEWENENDVQYRIEGGYGSLLDQLKNKCIDNGCTFLFEQVVKTIKWKEQNVEIITADNKSFFADKVIIAVPPIFLNTNTEFGISFHPYLEVISEAAKQIGYGGVIKVVFEFDHPFWETSKDRNATDLFFLFSQEKIPTWWSQMPDKIPMLTGWLAGPNSSEFAEADNDTILHAALHSLSVIFNIDVKFLQQYLKGSHVHNWLSDPLTKGGYSYNSTTSAAAKKILRTPVADTIFFCGEALSKKSNATVEAAFQSGKEVAENILSD